MNDQIKVRRQKNAIVASILAAKGSSLGKETEEVIKAGADWIHIDMMDNHFVPNLTFGPQICKDLRDYGITANLDVHLCAWKFNNLIPVLAEAGANYITFHPESTEDVHTSLKLIHQHGLKSGLAFSPSMSLEVLKTLKEPIHHIHIMSVNPGFGGQKFISSSLQKINEARKWIEASDKTIRLAVDGGIKLENIKDVAKAGADTFIIGTGIFKTEDYTKTIQNFKFYLKEAEEDLTPLFTK